ncbi:MAG: AAA family ATPase [Limisphaerales bacterium]|jgi:MoxR-like ATPase|nr:AAA family ATPase [Verrucomicrobiales bacterium]MCH2607392.1 MoxR family ATPase [Pedosphaera sp.]MED5494745.1 MoxR family ATPase [Verrucomicrobiota bacterium]HBV32554.1 AAA family ATPase [Verrucomicrobiales bacterium]|tara:strand:- start:351 stop:1361 length:1011 start_codon:yes stop_codon:yes gene_type:complete
MDTDTTDNTHEQDRLAVEQITAGREKIEQELGRVIIGQKDAVEEILITLFAGGNCLITGVPGLAKTLMVRAIAGIFDLDFHRIQFTPDLMPADITGTEILIDGENGRELQFVKGPVFTNVLLADEINRTPPKTQAALLEAMQEKQVSVGGTSRDLPKPFFVLATQNPIEMEGTYPLPEAQLDRFLLNVFIDYLPEEDEVKVVSETTSRVDAQTSPVFKAEDVLRIQSVVRKVPVADSVVRYAVRLAASSRPGQANTPDFVNEWINWGAGLRAGQALIIGAKARALLQGRSHVTPDDVKALAVPVLRHRILPNFKAEAEGVDADQVITKLVETVPVP